MGSVVADCGASTSGCVASCSNDDRIAGVLRLIKPDSVLGLLAGSVGVIFANVLTRVLLRKLEIHFHIDWLATVVALLGTAILATATGWIASYRILGLRPLEVLREE